MLLIFQALKFRNVDQGSVSFVVVDCVALLQTGTFALGELLAASSVFAVLT